MIKKIYSKYSHMKSRCYNPDNKSYGRYGGRGIRVCDEWLSDYHAFERWCLANGYRDGLAIDRIDNDGNYEPSNCRFVTLKENNQNRGTSIFYTINGVTKNLQQWCDYYGIKRGTVCTRLEHGWSIEDALTKPLFKKDKTSLLGKKFGRLTVLEYVECKPSERKCNETRWKCLCECGNIVEVGGWKLTSGHTKSCGCLQREIVRHRGSCNILPLFI